jgi:plasmid stabilization system protein ParE
VGRLLRTNAATEELVDIFTEAAERSPRLLARRQTAFARILELLADNPGLGVRRLPRYPVRVFPCERWLIFYRPLAAGDGIDVLRPSSSDGLGAFDLAMP